MQSINGERWCAMARTFSLALLKVLKVWILMKAKQVLKYFSAELYLKKQKQTHSSIDTLIQFWQKLQKLLSKFTVKQKKKAPIVPLRWVCLLYCCLLRLKEFQIKCIQLKWLSSPFSSCWLWVCWLWSSISTPWWPSTSSGSFTIRARMKTSPTWSATIWWRYVWPPPVPIHVKVAENWKIPFFCGSENERLHSSARTHLELKKNPFLRLLVWMVDLNMLMFLQMKPGSRVTAYKWFFIIFCKT